MKYNILQLTCKQRREKAFAMRPEVRLIKLKQFAILTLIFIFKRRTRQFEERWSSQVKSCVRGEEMVA